METIVRAIAVVRNDRREIVDDDWDSVTSRIELVEGVPSESLIGLGEFSHVEVIVLATLAEDVPPGPWHRHPRGNPDWPDVGIFAQRNKDRPNRLLVSVAAIDRVEERAIIVTGLDSLNDTPVLDIKPVFRWGGPRGVLHTPPWSDELGEGYF